MSVIHLMPDSNKVLGDYTLRQTLWECSTGKVKLATHNITGDKVRSVVSIIGR
jgi:hypothetical protein